MTHPKPLKTGIRFTHLGFLLLPLILCVGGAWIIILFADWIDDFMARWQSQFVLFIIISLIVGGTWFGKKLRG